MMGKIRNFSLIFLSVLVSCCSVKKHTEVQSDLKNKNILGRYVKDDTPYKTPNSEEIILLANNVVNYNLSVEFYGTHSFEGMWKLEKDTLNLSFDIPPEKKQGKIDVFYENDKQKTVDLTIVDNENNSLGGYSIFLDDKEQLITSKTLQIKPQFIRKIKIDTAEEVYEKQINKFVDTDMKIVLTPNQYRYALYDFLKTKWLIKSNRLIYLENGIPNKKYSLIKIK